MSEDRRARRRPLLRRIRIGEGEPKRERREEALPERPRRGSRTRFDRSGQVVLYALIGVAALAVVGAVVAIVLTRPAPDQRNANARPRSLDVWSVYPDGRVRFASLYYPDDSTAAPGTPQEVSVAGPLVFSEDDVLDGEVIGGTQEGVEIQPGPGQDADKLYQLFALTREAGGGPYGVDVMTTNSPYLTVVGDGTTTTLSLGAEVQSSFVQVIVAVALPHDAEITVQSEPSLQPYREDRLREWRVFFFDTTHVAEGDAIRIDYTAGSLSPDDLDPLAVDRRR
jgi:hypothetical protein